MSKQAGLKTGLEAGAGQDLKQKVQTITSSRTQGRTEKFSQWLERDQ